MRFLLSGIPFLFLVACASGTPQADSLLSRVYTNQASHLIEGVPFIEQKVGYCGPATLTMALQSAGRSVTVDEVAAQVYTPGMKGSLQADMISASRRQGMMAIPIEGFEALLEEVKAGHPVIVFENLSVSWLPQWHYAIVFGYDLRSQIVTMHSGPEAFKQWDIRKFERSWKLGGYWGLVVFNPQQTSASANELMHLSSASALELLGNLETANTAYQQILQRWPKSLGARIGLANIAYSRREYLRAVGFLYQAAVDHPESAIVWHNLAFAEAAVGNVAGARRNAVEALRRVKNDSRPIYANRLKEWIYPK